MANTKNTLIIENNYAGQLANLIREKTGYEFKNKVLKSDGRPFYIEEVEDHIKLALSKGYDSDSAEIHVFQFLTSGKNKLNIIAIIENYLNSIV